MRIGIIAEGRADAAVLKNILKGWLGLDSADIHYLRPELSRDETDLHNTHSGGFQAQRPDEFSSWTLVRRDCQERSKFEGFLNSVDEERLIIVQIDTAEAEEYDVRCPNKSGNAEYSSQLRALVIEKMSEWLEYQYLEHTRFAIAIEEIDAWVMTLYTKTQEDTAKFNNSKERLKRLLNRQRNSKIEQILRLESFEKYDELSKDFRKRKNIELCFACNQSLKLFCESLPSKMK